MNVVIEAKRRFMGMLSESIYDNPVVTKDFRTRMRGWKAFLTMGLYLILLSAILLIAFYILADASWNSYRSPSVLDRGIGKELFMVLVWVLAILMTLILPTLASSSLTGEVEKKTIQMLVLSKLTPGKIVLGKQLSGFLYALMLLVCSVPLAGICLIMGGISPEEIIITYLVLAGWGFLITCCGVFWSSMHKKSAIASGNCFGSAIAYFIATAIFGAASAFVSSYYGSMSIEPFCLLNPAYTPYLAMATSTVCGIKIPVALIAIIMHLGVGILLLLIASTHVLYTKVERALPIRLLILGLSVFAIWLMAGGSIPIVKDSIIYVGAVIMVVSMLMAAVFATGPFKISRNSSFVQYILSIRKTFSSNTGGAVSFVFLWSLLVYGTYGVTSFLADKTASYGGPASVTQMAKSAFSHSPVKYSTADLAFWQAYWKIGVYLLAMSICFSVIGLFASALVKQRRNAIALVIMLALFSFAIYGIALINYVEGGDNGSPFWNLAVLWPMTPLFACTGNWISMPNLVWIRDAWALCSAAYIVIAMVLAAFASMIFKKTGGIQEDAE